MLEYLLMIKMIKYLTEPYIKLDAYKLGIIDRDGKVLKKTWELNTYQEKNAYNTMIKFCLNLRRFIEKLPGGKSQLAKYLAVYGLFREDVNPDSCEANNLFEEFFNEDL